MQRLQLDAGNAAVACAPSRRWIEWRDGGQPPAGCRDLAQRLRADRRALHFVTALVDGDCIDTDAQGNIQVWPTPEGGGLYDLSRVCLVPP